MLVTAYSSNGLLRLTAPAGAQPLVLVSSTNAGSADDLSLVLDVSGATPGSMVWGFVGCTYTNGTANASGDVSLMGDAYEFCLDPSGTSTVSASDDDLRWGALTGVTLATTSLSLALAPSVSTRIDLDIDGVPSAGWYAGAVMEREGLPLASPMETLFIDSSGQFSRDLMGASHADAVLAGIMRFEPLSAGKARRQGVNAQKAFPAADLALDLSTLPGAVLDANYLVSGGRLSVEWDSTVGNAKALVIAATFTRDGSPGYWDLLLPPPLPGAQSFVFPPTPASIDPSPLATGSYFLVSLASADPLSSGEPVTWLFDKPVEYTVSFSCAGHSGGFPPFL